MRAVVIEEPGRAVVTEAGDPALAAEHVVVRVTACGLCRTDLHMLDGMLAAGYPLNPGTSSRAR